MQEEEKTKGTRNITRAALNVLKWTAIAIVGLIAFIVFLIYLPPVQDLAVQQVVKSINKGGEMTLSVKKLRLSFPLRLSVDSATMKSQGMDLAVGKASTKVAFSPLLKGVINAEEINLRDVTVNLGTPDSALYMLSNLREARAVNASVGLSSQEITLADLSADGGRLSLVMTPDTVPPPASDTAPAQWNITIDRAQLTDIDYSMRMLPTIDSLDCTLSSAVMTDGEVSLRNNRIKVNEIALSGADARYIVPTAEYIASHPVKETEATDTLSTPWTITVDKIRLADSHAIYATAGAVATSNFDPLFIEASEINIAVDSFRNRGTEITVPIKEISARERCGVSMKLTGLFEMDSTEMRATGMRLTTPSSEITLDASMGMMADTRASSTAKGNSGNAVSLPPTPVSLKMSAEISNDDMRRLVPQAMAPMIASLPRYTPLEATADINGTLQDLDVEELCLELPRHIKLQMEGSVRGFDNLDNAVGNLTINGSMPDGKFLKPMLLDAKMQKEINLPPMSLKGYAGIDRGIINGDIQAWTGDGRLALDASWNNRRKAYDVTFDANSFPVQSIMPGLGLKDVSAEVTLNGVGIDVMDPKTDINANVDLAYLVYNGHALSDIKMDAALSGGMAKINATSNNTLADLTLNAEGNISGQTYDWTFYGDVRNLDLHALALTDSVMGGSVALSGKASFTPGWKKREAYTDTIGRRRVRRYRDIVKPMNISGDIDISSLKWRMGKETLTATDMLAAFNASDSTVTAKLSEHDLKLGFSSGVCLDTLLARFTGTSLLLDRCMKRQTLAVDSLQRALPPFGLDLSAGTDNILADYLSQSKITFKSIDFQATNDSLINATGLVTGFKTGETRLDSISLALHQQGDYLTYNINVDNRPGTFDQFAHILAQGYIGSERLALVFRQQNISGDVGYSFGSIISMQDSTTMALRFVPFHPVIGYKDWEINRDNILTYNFKTHHIDANVDLRNDVSSVEIYTDHDSIVGHSHDTDAQDDVILKLKDIKLSDWLALNPFMPEMKGDVSADLRFHLDMPDINGKGVVSLTDFTYGRKRVGSFDLDLDVSTNAAGTVRASTSLMVDGVKTITAVGNLNDSTAVNPFLLDFRMIRFPLTVVNPFLPPGTAELTGTLNGEMDVTGDLANPIFNGFLDFDSTAVNVDALSTALTFSDKKIPIQDNIVTFSDFEIKGVNENPLQINGTVDMKSLSMIRLDLDMKARNMQIVGSDKRRPGQAYGKAFVNIDGSVKGSLSFLDVNASVNLLPGTNVTYVLADATNIIQSRSNQEMVKFVNFTDTAAVESADSLARPSMLMNIDAQLTISNNTTVAVDLSTNGKNKVQLGANGTINYSLDYMNDENVTGRININDGFVRYTPPLMSEKLFNFEEGSYIAFNGDMMNPILNVHAVDNLKANVTQQGSDTRTVEFNVGLGVTGTLENMNVAFDLSSPNDITVENELKSMSPEQRANQAMNLLIYNVYSGPGTHASVGGNPLFSFLSSQLNTWAANTIKGVDLSFGINQYDKTVNGASNSTMSYSYQVSKSLFDDRFKIVVGGNYTTDADADENFAQNLIADISFEYMLNRSGSMYVRLFRHTGYESILEGEITQTGVGFVYKKKLRQLKDMFRFLKRKQRREAIEEVKTATGESGLPPAPEKGDIIRHDNEALKPEADPNAD